MNMNEHMCIKPCGVVACVNQKADLSTPSFMLTFPILPKSPYTSSPNLILNLIS